MTPHGLLVLFKRLPLPVIQDRFDSVAGFLQNACGLFRSGFMCQGIVLSHSLDPRFAIFENGFDVVPLSAVQFQLFRQVRHLFLHITK